MLKLKLILPLLFVSAFCFAQSPITYGASVDSLGRYTAIRTIQTKTSEGVQVTQSATEWMTRDAAILYYGELLKHIAAQKAQAEAILQQILAPAQPEKK